MGNKREPDSVPPDADPRIAELETRVAFQDQTISELNDVVIELRNQIDRVELATIRLKDRVEAAAPVDGSFASDDQKPPHY